MTVIDMSTENGKKTANTVPPPAPPKDETKKDDKPAKPVPTRTFVEIVRQYDETRFLGIAAGKRVLVTVSNVGLVNKGLKDFVGSELTVSAYVTPGAVEAF